MKKGKEGSLHLSKQEGLQEILFVELRNVCKRKETRSSSPTGYFQETKIFSLNQCIKV